MLSILFILLLLVVISYGFNHLLICFDDQGANIIADLAVVDFACVSTDLVI